MIAKLQPLFLQPVQQEFLLGRLWPQPVDGVIQIGMLHAQLDETAVGRAQVLIHRRGDWRAGQGVSPLYERTAPHRPNAAIRVCG